MGELIYLNIPAYINFLETGKYSDDTRGAIFREIQEERQKKFWEKYDNVLKFLREIADKNE